MGELLTTIPAILLLIFLLWNHKKRQAWQSRYDAVEQTAIEIARNRMETLPIR
ncbi:MAG: hypothetical protein HOC52_01445 [Thiotrichales bacterium]|jgi:hypothetical protein|nr:hypothetical protein [Thiotrichales bacterium]